MRRLPLQFAQLTSLFRKLRERLKASRRRRFARQLTPITFRQLEPRRVLTVTSVLDAAGQLSIDLTAGESVGLYHNGTNFFVDQDGSTTLNGTEFSGSLAALKSLVVEDNNTLGSFIWGSVFTVDSANLQIANSTLSGTLTIKGDMTIDATGSVLVPGTTTISGDVRVEGNLDIGDTASSLVNTDNAKLTVLGHAQLDAKTVTLGTATNDTINLGSISFDNVLANVTLHEDGSSTVSGTSTLNSLTLRSTGSIEIANASTLNATGTVILDARA